MGSKYSEEERKERKREYDREYHRKYREENPEKSREYHRKLLRENPEKSREYRRKWKQENRDKYKECQRSYYQKNREKGAAKTAKRKAAKLQRTPCWLTEDDLFMIKEAYALAKLREKVTGFKWHVDHIVPLQGNIVSGMHVPNNLQVIPGATNCSKHNKWNWYEQR
jgi:hypothetical protein